MLDDEPTTTTLLILGAAGAGAAAAEQSRKAASKSAAASREATAEGKRLADEAANKKTAGSVTGLSEQAKRSRRVQASSLTREFAPPTLAVPALTGA